MKERYRPIVIMNIDVKKMLADRIQHYTHRIVHHEQ
jgi:hypothetical protein